MEASGKLDFGELELELWDSRYMLRGHKDEPRWTGYLKYIKVVILLLTQKVAQLL